MKNDRILQRLGERIRDTRLSVSKTQVEMAEAAGISGPFWSLIETGRRDPSWKTLAAIAKALRCSVRDLIPDGL